MNHSEPDLWVLEVEFPLEENASAPAGVLKLIPHRYQPSYGTRPEEGRFVYIGLKVQQFGFECTAYDVLGADTLRRLREVLNGYRRAAPESFTFGGWDHHFELETRWREVPGDVAIVGRIPPHGWQELCSSIDPTVYRKWIRLDVRFEFLIDPRRLDAPIEQLDVLLAFLVEEEKRAKQTP